MPVDGDIILKAGLDTTGISKRLDSLQKTVSKGLKNAIRLGFGVRSVFALVRKLRSALFEGFENLAQVHQPFNKAMSDIMTSLNLLKNTFAAAFAPIIETVAPILTKFINMIAEAVSQIGQLIAALTGKEYVRAASVQIDYAESVSKSTSKTNKATSATKKQTKAQKELNKEITHFDDLVILHSNKDTDTDTSSPVTTAPQVSFSKAPIGDAVSKFAKDFLAAWDKWDFSDLGRKIGEKLKKALDNIPWPDIKKTLSHIAVSLATFLNGFLETPGLFSSIGKTIAEAINSAVVFANSFVWSFHWGSLGAAVRDKLIATLSGINWPMIFNTLKGFAIGLADYLNALFTPETFDAIGKTVGNLIRGALIFLNTFGERFDATQFGASLATGINSALKKISVSQLITGVKTIITTLRDAIVGFMSTINWYGIGFKLREIIKNLPWKLLLMSVGLVIWQAINSAVELFKGLFDTDNISGPIQTAIENLSTIIQTAAQNIDFKAIGDGLDRIVKALAPAVEGFAAGFITAMGIFIEMGSDLLQILGPALQAIADALGSIDPDVVAAIGTGLGLIAGSLFAISLINGAVTILTNVGAAVITLNGVVPTAAAALGMGQGGLAAALSMVAAAAGGLYLGMELGKEEIVSTTEELKPLNQTHQDTIDILQSVADQYGLTKEQVYELAWEMSNATDEHSNFAAVMGLVDTNVSNAGIDVGSFKDSLSKACEVARNEGKDISTVQSYIDGVATSASESETNTSAFAGAFDLFDGLSLTTPLKMALLSGAIGALGDKGKLSKEDTDALYTTLDEYDANPTKENMDKVAKAFEDTGISADDFTQALVDSMMTMDTSTQKEITSVLSTITKSGPNLKKESETSFKNVGKGATSGLKNTTDDVAKAGRNMVSDTFNAMDDEADSHSPSREAMKRGEYIGQGLGIGLENERSTIVQIATQLINAIKDEISSYTSQFESLGNDLMQSLSRGLSTGGSNLSSYMSSIMQDVYYAANSLDFWDVGRNIAYGIYNGLYAHSQWLETLAWNTAVSMYNSACYALRIASPSKKFAWIGEMVAKGLGNGVTDNQDEAVGAVEDMTQAMTDEAEKTNPSISINSSIDNWIDELDEVLTTFSDTVIDKFDNLITVFAQLGNIQTSIPAVAQGRVIPSSIQAANSTNDAMASMLDMMQDLQSLASDRMDISDLRTLLVEMFTRYMSWSIGDEQLARHVNNGNLLLERRYSTIKE